MTNKILPKQLTKRFYVLMLALVIIPFIFLDIFAQLRYIDDRTKEREEELLFIAKYLNQSLPCSISEFIDSNDALNKTPKEKVLALNEVLQPVINEVSNTHPYLGLGYYSMELDSIVGIAPNYNPDLLTRVPRSFPYFECYKTGTPEVSRSCTSIGWYGESILNVTYPIIENGKIVGHSWANIKMDDIYAEVWDRTQSFLYIMLIMIASIVIISRFIFNSFINELQQVAACIVNDNVDKINLERIPVIEPIIKLINKRTLELKDSEARLRTIFEGISIGIALDDINGKIIECNSALASMLGYSVEEMCDMYYSNFTHPEDIDKEKVLYNELVERQRKQYQLEKRYISKEGKVIWVKVRVSTDRENKFIITLIEDITELKMYQQEIARLDRLNIVGQMAASVSHEVRNPMTTVRGFMQMLANKKDYEKDKKYFDLMISELDRAESIITEFLSIGKNKPSELKDQNLNIIIDTIAPLLQADALRSNKEIELQLNDIPELALDSKEIRQVILNLVRNGLEAMETNGKITINTYFNEDNVILKITDQGPGIPPNILHKLGTPFFTTKEKGTGLGLATCYNIIEKHNGKLKVETNDRGTTFSISFPVK